MTKKERRDKIFKFLRPKLRRASYMWKARTEAKGKARIARGKYVCNGCKGIFGPKEISLDHIEPVIDPAKGFTTFDDYILKMFCDKDSFQVLCSTCHDKKTQEENKVRKETKKKKKDKKKS